MGQAKNILDEELEVWTIIFLLKKYVNNYKVYIDLYSIKIKI